MFCRFIFCLNKLKIKAVEVHRIVFFVIFAIGNNYFLTHNVIAI